MSIINKIVQYFKDSIRELKRVIWPTKKEATNLTLLVILISLGVSFFLGFFDWLLTIGLGSFMAR